MTTPFALKDGWEKVAQTPDARRAIARGVPPPEWDKSGIKPAALVHEALPPDTYPTIIELGCGMGRVTRWLTGYETIYAVDIAPSMVKEMDRLNLPGVYPICSNGTDLQLPQVDAVYSSLTLMHNTTEDIYAIFRALRPLIRPGGRFAFQLPVYSRHVEPYGWRGVAQWTWREVINLAYSTGYSPYTIYRNSGTYNKTKPETIGPHHFDLHIFEVAK